MPQYENLTLKHISQFCNQYPEVLEYLPDPIDIPKTVALACFAISCGVEDVDYAEPEGRAITRDARHRQLTRTT